MNEQQLVLEIEGLKAENERLSGALQVKKTQIKVLRAKVKKLTFPPPKHAPFPRRADAKLCADSFRNAGELVIPQSIMFLSTNLGYLAHAHPYVRFYMGTKAGSTELTLIAVGVDSNNMDEDNEIPLGGGQITTTMYEFADPCPKCVINDIIEQKESLLYEKNKPCRFIFKKISESNDCLMAA